MVTPFAHTLIPERRDDKGIATKGIQIGPWTLHTVKGRIYDSEEMGRLNDINVPFPEMFFGYNSLELTHSNGLKLSFNAHKALSMVHDTTCDQEDLVQVSYSQHWKKSRESSKESAEKLVISRPYDWTYTTMFNGSVVLPDTLTWEDSPEEINIPLLKRQDPILFYETLPLFEDELGDNGAATLSLRVRVMPTCLLILQRFFLRVDSVLVRVIETRVFHEFSKNYMIRECGSHQTPFDELLQALRRHTHRSPSSAADGEDLSKLTDQDFVVSLLPPMTQASAKMYTREKILL